MFNILWWVLKSIVGRVVGLAVKLTLLSLVFVCLYIGSGLCADTVEGFHLPVLKGKLMRYAQAQLGSIVFLTLTAAVMWWWTKRHLSFNRVTASLLIFSTAACIDAALDGRSNAAMVWLSLGPLSCLVFLALPSCLIRILKLYSALTDFPDDLSVEIIEFASSVDQRSLACLEARLFIASENFIECAQRSLFTQFHAKYKDQAARLAALMQASSLSHVLSPAGSHRILRESAPTIAQNLEPCITLGPNPAHTPPPLPPRPSFKLSSSFPPEKLEVANELISTWCDSPFVESVRVRSDLVEVVFRAKPPVIELKEEENEEGDGGEVEESADDSDGFEIPPDGLTAVVGKQEVKLDSSPLTRIPCAPAGHCSIGCLLGDTYIHKGVAWRLDQTSATGSKIPTLHTAFHVLMSIYKDDLPLAISVNGKVLPFNYSVLRFSDSRGFDFVSLVPTAPDGNPCPNTLSNLGIGNLSYKRANATGGAIVASFDGSQWFKAAGGYRCGLHGSLHHTCSTMPGTSGAPIMSNNSVIGIHSGGHESVGNIGFRWYTPDKTYQLETTAPDKHEQLMEKFMLKHEREEMALVKKQVWENGQVSSTYYSGERTHKRSADIRNFETMFMVSAQTYMDPVKRYKDATREEIDNLRMFADTVRTYITMIVIAAIEGLEVPTYRDFHDLKKYRKVWAFMDDDEFAAFTVPDNVVFKLQKLLPVTWQLAREMIKDEAWVGDLEDAIYDANEAAKRSSKLPELSYQGLKDLLYADFDRDMQTLAKTAKESAPPTQLASSASSSGPTAPYVPPSPPVLDESKRTEPSSIYYEDIKAQPPRDGGSSTQSSTLGTPPTPQTRGKRQKGSRRWVARRSPSQVKPTPPPPRA